MQQPLAACIPDAEKEFNACKTKLARITGLEINYNQFMATAHRDNMCEICKRGFHGPEDRQQFIQMQVWPCWGPGAGACVVSSNHWDRLAGLR